MLIILDEVPVSKNKYVNQHWAKRRNYKDGILEKMKEYISFEKSIDSNTFKDKNLPYKKAKLTMNIYFKTHRRRDIHNYVGGGLISWIDCLINLGFIEDDCYDCIGQPRVFFYYDNDFPRTEIQIERRE